MIPYYYINDSTHQDNWVFTGKTVKKGFLVKNQKKRNQKQKN